MYTRIVSAALLTAALTGCRDATGVASAEVPFSGSLEAAEQTVVVRHPIITQQATGGGVATHLGRYTLAFEALVNVSNGKAAVTYALTADNGDRLLATADGQSVPLPDRPGFAEVTETARVTGGTGRFAGAGGSFTVVRLLDYATFQSSGTIDGRIRLAR